MRLTRIARPQPTSYDRFSGRSTPRRRRTLLTIAGAGCALGFAVLAATVIDPGPASAATTRVVAVAASVSTVLTNIRNWIMGILASVATVFLTIGGLRYVIANGDPGEVQKAKTAFKSAALGYGLAALAPLVVTVLQGIVGG
jgi:hypothetical protein